MLSNINFWFFNPKLLEIWLATEVSSSFIPKFLKPIVKVLIFLLIFDEIDATTELSIPLDKSKPAFTSLFNLKFTELIIFSSNFGNSKNFFSGYFSSIIKTSFVSLNCSFDKSNSRIELGLSCFTPFSSIHYLEN